MLARLGTKVMYRKMQSACTLRAICAFWLKAHHEKLSETLPFHELVPLLVRYWVSANKSVFSLAPPR
jgi:hypothetical protein